LAQSVYGSLQGRTTVKASGQPVPGVTVLVSSLEHGDLVTSSTQTDDSGRFNFGNLPLGAYIVSMKKDGYKTWKDDVTVSADYTSEIDVGLVPGDPSTTTEGDPPPYPVLPLDRADVATSFSRHEIESLPVLAQNVSFYELLVPGAVRTLSVLPSQQNPQSGVYASVSGQPVSGTAVFEDGTVNRDPISGVVVLNPSLDFVSELKITTTAYDAEFGQASQAVISAQTKSGTNDLHGGGFWYRRDQRGQARDPFAQSQPLAGTTDTFIPPTLWNQFGGSIGGPIQKDKTFFFGDYQGTAQKNGGSLLTRTLTAAERAGNLSDLNTAIFNPCNGTNCNVAPASRTQFPGNVIPSSDLSPQAEALLTYIPMPNIASAVGANPNYAASGFGVVNWNGFDNRIDRYQTDKLHMFGRYSFLQVSQTNPGAFGFEAGGPTYSTTAFSGAARLRDQSQSPGKRHGCDALAPVPPVHEKAGEPVIRQPVQACLVLLPVEDVRQFPRGSVLAPAHRDVTVKHQRSVCVAIVH